MEFINILLLLDFEPQLETLSPLFTCYLTLLALVFKLKSYIFGGLSGGWCEVRLKSYLHPHREPNRIYRTSSVKPAIRETSFTSHQLPFALHSVPGLHVMIR